MPVAARIFAPAIALAAVALPATLATTLPAPAIAAGAGQCLYIQQITGTKADGMRTVYARAGRHDVWRIDLSADCAPLADGGGKIVVSPRGSGSICGASDLKLAVEAPGGSQSCFVGGLRKLTAEEASSLPANVAP
jgi:hypothetical protein